MSPQPRQGTIFLHASNPTLSLARLAPLAILIVQFYFLPDLGTALFPPPLVSPYRLSEKQNRAKDHRAPPSGQGALGEINILARHAGATWQDVDANMALALGLKEGSHRVAAS